MKNQEKHIQQSMNEWKGHLFEYLVAEYVTHQALSPLLFYKRLSPSLMLILQRYQQLLQGQNQFLYQRLPLWAQQTGELMCHLIHQRKEIIESVEWIGKQDQKDLSRHEEADLLLFLKDQAQAPYSLKLCRFNSYVNTKNGGVKSFFQRFFSYAWNDQKQKDFEESLDLFYQQLTQRLMALSRDTEDGHEEEDLSLDQYWERNQRGHLPGDLEGEEKMWVHHWYHEVISFIYQQISWIFAQDQWQLQRNESLLSLMGREQKDLWQVFAFHGGEFQDLKKILLMDNMAYKKEMKHITLRPLRVGKSFFEVAFTTLRLQIRVKPMNRFTSQALKVNCSVKFVLADSERPSFSWTELS
jgi:hypothetical protein